MVKIFLLIDDIKDRIETGSQIFRKEAQWMKGKCYADQSQHVRCYYK